MKLILIGPGQLGTHLMHAAAGERLAIGEDAGQTQAFAEAQGCAWSLDLRDAADGDVIAAAVPAGATPAVLEAVAGCVKPGAVVLNFATACDIAPALRERRPDVHWLEAKMAGSAVGMAHGLQSAIVLGPEADEALLAQVRAALPGLADSFLPGDPSIVSAVNTLSTEAALRAAITVKKELAARGVPQTVIDAAVGCGLPGTAISFQRGTLGAFARNIVHKLENEG